MHLLVHEQRWTVCRKGTLVESNQGSLFASQRVITLMCLVTEPVVISCLDFFVGCASLQPQVFNPWLKSSWTPPSLTSFMNGSLAQRWLWISDFKIERYPSRFSFLVAIDSVCKQQSAGIIKKKENYFTFHLFLFPF